MRIRGETTEERIAKIADGFNKGAQNFFTGQRIQKEEQYRNDARSLQEEAQKRQRALQELETEAKLTEATGRNVIGSGIGSKIMRGERMDPELISSLPLSRKAEQDAADRALKAEDRGLDREYKKSQIAKNYRPPKAAVTGTDKVTQKQMEKLGVDNAQLFKVKGAMDEALEILQDKTIPDAQKIKTGQSLFKLLNSAEGSDAVGVEEAQRLGSYLEYNIANFTQPGAFVGRDLRGFTDQVKNYSKLLGGRIQKGEEGINLLKGGGSLSQSVNTRQAAPGGAPQTVIQNGFTYTLNPQTGQYE